ncbi:MAG: hypothetical protein VYC34_02340 [Planctomycetota bacterium]|nr:hypothetical protein [Planctomycetota bacterium]
MKVFLDEQAVECGGGTLAIALDAGAAAARSRGRLIIEAQADGKAIPQEHLDEPPGEDPYAEEIRLVSVDPRAFLRTTLLDAVDALEQTRGDQKRAAELIQTGEAREALSTLSEILNTWQAVRRVLEDASALIGVAPEAALQHGAPDDQTTIESLFKSLDELRRSLAEQDWTATADALEFDLDEQAARWQTSLRSLAEAVAEGGE